MVLLTGAAALVAKKKNDDDKIKVAHQQGGLIYESPITAATNMMILILVIALALFVWAMIRASHCGGGLNYVWAFFFPEIYLLVSYVSGQC